VKITKIEAQLKTQGRYSVYVDEVFAFGISELGLINNGLRVGGEYTKQELETLKEEAKTDKIYNQTLGLIARRPRSQWEIEDYFRRKDVEPTVSQGIIDILLEKKFIDDLDFARRWVESRRLLKSISRRKLEFELRTKRVDNSLIKQVLDEDNTDELEVITAEINKKRRQTRYQDDSKLMAYLARQGYSYETIKKALADNTE